MSEFRNKRKLARFVPDAVEHGYEIPEGGVARTRDWATKGKIPAEFIDGNWYYDTTNRDQIARILGMKRRPDAKVAA